jgi:rhamnose transport system ATP-binding protein
VNALSGVNFDLQRGEVHALVGENGAGKSTLIKIITGAHLPDSGTLEIDGQRVDGNSPLKSKALGVAAIYQQPALFPDLTIAENIALGLESRSIFGRIDWNVRRKRARELLDLIGARIDPATTAGELSIPEQQLVEIARALGAQAKILILDEPTASLSEEEVENLFRVIQDLKQRQVGMIYISHRLEELRRIGDRVTVLRDGRSIATHAMSEITDQELIRLMVGRELKQVFPKREVPIGGTVLEVRQLGSRASGIEDVSFSLRAGEILGLAGLVGSGRTEVARALFGVTPADRGEIRMSGRPIRIADPSDAVESGIAYVPEDRRRHGVVLELPIAANTTLASLRRIAKFGLIDYSAEREITIDYVDRLGVKTHSIFAPAAVLSGGNQQKVALGRWLATGPTVLILDEPTQGIDVGAKSEIHRLMCDLAERGFAILMISSELPEILGMSDRIGVMRQGRLVAVLDRKDATDHSIMALAFGHGT